MDGPAEITEPVDLCDASGRLNPAAVGWTRRPLHRANLRGWGRTKRWEYWCVQTPDFVLALTIGHADFVASHTVWFRESQGREELRTVLVPLARGPKFPDTSGGGTVAVSRPGLSIVMTPTDRGVRLQARTDRLSAEVEVMRPPGHESLGVVIPWDDRRFQYTVKENALPAQGVIRIDERTFRFGPPDAWAVLDHGRGRWPYRTVWNWGSASGLVGDSVVGLQFGGKWTDGTGLTENALCIDGRLHKVHDDLRWDNDREDWLQPWRITDPVSGRVDLTFTPSFERREATQLLVAATEVHQCFGVWSGHVIDDFGRRIPIGWLSGFAEESRMRW